MILGSDKELFSCQIGPKRFEGHPDSYSKGAGNSFSLSKSNWNAKLTIHPYLVAMSRKSNTFIHKHPWRGTQSFQGQFYLANVYNVRVPSKQTTSETKNVYICKPFPSPQATFSDAASARPSRPRAYFILLYVRYHHQEI